VVDDRSLLDFAAVSSLENVTEFLLKGGARCYEREILRRVELHRVAALLLEAKACEIPTNHLFSVFGHNGFIDRAKLYLLHGADVNYKENDQTFIEYCTYYGYEDLLTELNRFRTNPNYLDDIKKEVK